MRTKRVVMFSVCIICCVVWAVNILAAAKYDPLVEKAQKRLAELGYEVGTPDGKLGPKTIEAIKKFQQDQELTVTGKLDEETVEKLGIAEPEPQQPTPTPDPTKDAEAFKSRGLDYLNNGEYDLAIREYTQAITLKPEDVVAYNNRGLAYSNKGESERAIEDYTQAITLNPKDAVTYYNRGFAYWKKEEYDRAIDDCTQAVTLNPKLTGAYNIRGIAYDNKGEHDLAIKDYTQAITLNPNDAVIYYNRGLSYLNKGENDHAIEDYTQAITLKPDYAVVYNDRGRVYTAKGEYDRAIEDYTQAITLKSDYAVAYGNRGLAYWKKGEYDRAIEDCTQAITLNPKLAGVYNNRGLAYDNKGEYDRAIEDYTQAITLNPNDAVIYYNRGLSYWKKREYDRAIEDYTASIALKPDYADAYNYRGQAYAHQGQHDLALEDFKKACDLGIEEACKSFASAQKQSQLEETPLSNQTTIEHSEFGDSGATTEQVSQVMIIIIEVITGGILLGVFWKSKKYKWVSLLVIALIIIVYLTIHPRSVGIPNMIDRLQDWWSRVQKNIDLSRRDFWSSVQTKTDLSRSDELPPLVYEVLDSFENRIQEKRKERNPISDDELINSLKEAVQQNPQNPKIHMGLALSYHTSDYFMDALKHYLIARENAPDAADPLIGLGRLCYDLAISDMTFRGIISKDSSGLPQFIPDERALQLLRVAKEKFLAAKAKTIFMGDFSPSRIDEFLEMIYVKINDAGASLWKEQDYEAAVSLWTEAAESGMPIPQYNLSRAYFEGKGVPKNFEKAAEWCQKAADQNYAEAQVTLATFYVKGTGVPEDIEKALELFRKAAAQGDQRAREFLDSFNEQGSDENRLDGTEKDAKHMGDSDDITDVVKEVGEEFVTAELTLLLRSLYEKGLYSEEKIKNLMNSEDFQMDFGNRMVKLLVEWGPDIARLNPEDMSENMRMALENFRSKLREDAENRLVENPTNSAVK